MQPDTLERVQTMTPRELAGAIVRDERARLHLTQIAGAVRLGTSRAQLSRVEAGQTVGNLTLRSIESGLGLPTHLLSHVIDADSERIKRLPSKADDPFGIREDLRVYVLDALRDITQPPPHNRRSTDPGYAGNG